MGLEMVDMDDGCYDDDKPKMMMGRTWMDRVLGILEFRQDGVKARECLVRSLGTSSPGTGNILHICFSWEHQRHHF